MDKFLRSRLVAAVTALLRHRTAGASPLDVRGILPVHPKLKKAAFNQAFDARLADFSAPGDAVNIDAAIAQGGGPLPKRLQRPTVKKVARCLRWVGCIQASVHSLGSADRKLRDQTKIKKSHRPRTIGSWQASYYGFTDRRWRLQCGP
jgi:hypothetical protein